MKKFCKLSLVLLVLVAVSFGCRPDGVGPDGGAKNPSIKASESDNHEAMTPVCGTSRTFQLVSEDGSATVNRCFGPLSQGNPLIACPAAMPPWGTVTVMNGLEDYVIDVQLPIGWFGQAQVYKIGDPTSFNWDTNGKPVMDNSWTSKMINPVVGKWQMRNAMSGTGNHFGVMMKLTVIKLNMLGHQIPTSVTTLWLKDPEASASAPSPFMAEWDRAWCSEQWPAPQAVCAFVNVGNAALSGCTNLAPSVTNPVGTVAYNWSTGATTPAISVCPTATTNYTVSISDASGPRAIYDYTVNVRDVSCTQGNNNNQHKVNVCHIPPGNPNNPNEICIDWSGVPAHVAEYRPAGSTQGHDSGCEIGKCGSNPCE